MRLLILLIFFSSCSPCFAAFHNKSWSDITRDAIHTYGQDMLHVSRLKDAKYYCPRFSKLSVSERLQVFTTLISQIAKYESAYKTNAKYTENLKDRFGNYVVSRGLLQLSIESANGYGCRIKNAIELHNPKTNLECGVRILNKWVSRDRYIGTGSRGGARYWATLRNHSYAQSKIRSKIRALSFCRR